MRNLITLMETLPSNFDAALITGDTNRRYYTDFPSSAGTLVVTKDKSYLIIDSRYFEAATENAKDCQVILQDKLYEQVNELLEKHQVKNLGVESATMTVVSLAQLEEKLPNMNIVSDNTLSDLINAQRAIKSETEKEYIQLSQNITDKTFEYACSIIKAGKTEKEIALEMEFFSRQNGSDDAAFSFIVASGPNTSRPHAVPTDRVIKEGDFVLMDFGSTYNGYLSDMTRTVAVGSASDKMVEVYNTVLAAQQKCLDIIKAGIPYIDVHMVAENIINEKFPGTFGHGLGHSLGLEIHEPPNFNKVTKGNAVAGNVMSVEPGIYLPGEFGVRIEDIVYVTEQGLYNFTNSKKELIVL